MSAIVWSCSKHELSKERLAEILPQLTKNLLGRCQGAFIFGSAAEGTFREESDIDLVILTSTSLPFTERAFEFRDLLDIFPRMDILVYTPEEFERMKKQEHGFFSEGQKILTIL